MRPPVNLIIEPAQKAGRAEFLFRNLVCYSVTSGWRHQLFALMIIATTFLISLAFIYHASMLGTGRETALLLYIQENNLVGSLSIPFTSTHILKVCIEFISKKIPDCITYFLMLISKLP